MSTPVNTTGLIRNYTTTRDKLVVAEGFNVRFDMGDLEHLAQSIAVHGIERNLVVERRADGMLEVTDGHRRLAAFDLAVTQGKLDAASAPIPVQIEKSSTPEERLGQMARSNDGKPLTPLEEAALYKRLQDIYTAAGMGIQAGILKICETVGRGDVHVRDRLSLLTATPEVQEAVKSGAIRATFAQQIIAASKQGLKGNPEAIAARQRELLAEASTTEGRREVRARVDGDARKKRALSLKVQQLKDALDETNEKVHAKLDAIGKTRKELKDKVGSEMFEIIKLIGAESALRAIVRGAEAASEE